MPIVPEVTVSLCLQMGESSLQVLWCDYVYLWFLMFTKKTISTHVLDIRPVLVNRGWSTKSGLFVWQMNVQARQTFFCANLI